MISCLKLKKTNLWLEGFTLRKIATFSGKCKATNFETMKYFLKNSYKVGKINFYSNKGFNYKKLIEKNDTKR